MKILKKLLVMFIVVIVSITSSNSKTYASGVEHGDTNQSPIVATEVDASEETLESNQYFDEQGQIITLDVVNEEDNSSEEIIEVVDNNDEVKKAEDKLEDLNEVNIDEDKADEVKADEEVKEGKAEDKSEVKAEEDKAEEDKDKEDKDKEDKAEVKKEKVNGEEETTIKKEKKAKVEKVEKPSYSESDLRLLASLIYAEAGNQSYDGMLAVANVVLNRVKSDVYWHVDSVEEVIYDNKWAVQFAVTKKNKSGVSMLDKALKSYDTGKYSGSNQKAEQEAMNKAIKAAIAALEGENNIESYLCFNAVNSGTKKIKNKYSYKIISDHIFYRKGA